MATAMKFFPQRQSEVLTDAIFCVFLAKNRAVE
jgi:hypothetical protein